MTFLLCDPGWYTSTNLTSRINGITTTTTMIGGCSEGLDAFRFFINSTANGGFLPDTILENPTIPRRFFVLTAYQVSSHPNVLTIFPPSDWVDEGLDAFRLFF